MEVMAAAVAAGLVAALGYLLRRLIERSGETERLRRQDLALEVERKRRELSGAGAAVRLVLVVLQKE